MTSIVPTVEAEELARLEQRTRYAYWRWSVMEACFVGYAFFYLVRNNFQIVQSALGKELHASNEQLGQILAVNAITYGVGKFLLGSLSDRSNARFFMPLGLLLSAVLNITVAFTPTLSGIFWVWALNGFVQGMGWPACGRALSHWYRPEERAAVFGFWNTSHNIGGALVGPLCAWVAASAWGWRAAFFVPAALSLLCAGYLLFRLRDRPEVEGLPSIAHYTPENSIFWPKKLPSKVEEQPDEERKPSFREILLDKVLLNPWIWAIALANFFAYILRYSLLDWGPTYLAQAKGASLAKGGLSTFLFELSAVISTIGVGFLSDRLGGKRLLVSLLCIVPMFGAFVGIAMLSASEIGLALLCFGVVGFCIYPALMLFTVITLDLTSKHAIGAAAGFIGLFGYLGKSVQAYGLGWLSTHYSWDVAFQAIGVVLVLLLVLLAILWRLRPQL